MSLILFRDHGPDESGSIKITRFTTGKYRLCRATNLIDFVGTGQESIISSWVAPYTVFICIRFVQFAIFFYFLIIREKVYRRICMRARSTSSLFDYYTNKFEERYKTMESFQLLNIRITLPFLDLKYKCRVMGIFFFFFLFFKCLEI